MAYTDPPTWVNGAPPTRNATNLNKLSANQRDHEGRIIDHEDRIDGLEAAPGGSSGMTPVDTVTDLTTLPGTSVGDKRLVLGYSAINDGGGGLVYDTNAGGIVDGGDILAHVSGGSRRWTRIYIGETYKNARQFGAKGNRTQDDAPAINAAVAASGGGVVYAPKGEYECRTPLNAQDFTTLKGDGYLTSLIATNSVSTLLHPNGNLLFGLKDIRLKTEVDTSVLLRISGSFNGAFENVVFDGRNDLTAGKPNQTGVLFDSNAGDNHFTNCRWFNLGTGVITRCIQNYITNYTMSGCIRGLWADTGNSSEGQFNAGIVMQGGTFAAGTSGALANRMVAAVQIDVEANHMVFENLWVEGTDDCFRVGPVGAGGPLTFKLSGAKMACRQKHLVINSSRTTVLDDIFFASETDTATGLPTVGPDITIDGTHSPNGVALALESALEFEIPTSRFPAGWVYYLRGSKDFA